MKILLGLSIGSQTSPRTAPGWLLNALQSIEVIQGDGGRSGEWSQGFQMQLRAERAKGSGSDYDIVESGLLKPGQRLIVTVTLDGTPHVLLDSVITWRQLTLDGEGSTVNLRGKDLSALMDLETRDVSHAGMGDKEIVSHILSSKYAKYGITARVSEPASSWRAPKEEREPRQVVTDLEYLRMLANRHSFVFLIRPGPSAGKCEALWGREESAYSPAKSLTANAGPSTNVERLEAVENALAAVRTTGAVDAGKPGELMKIDIKKGSDSARLAKTSALNAYADLLSTRPVRYSGPYPKEAEALAQSRTDRSVERSVVLTGALDTLRYGALLHAPGRVEVRGAGATFDGKYRVVKVTHKISRGEYHQEFELARPGTGSAVTKVSPS